MHCIWQTFAIKAPDADAQRKTLHQHAHPVAGRNFDLSHSGRSSTMYKLENSNDCAEMN